MLSEKPWKLEGVALLFLGVICSVLLASLPVWLVHHFGADLPKAQADFWAIFLGAIALEAPIIGLTALLVHYYRTTWKDAFFHATELPTAIAYGVLGGALFVPAGWLLETGSDWILTKLKWDHPNQDLVLELQQQGLNIPEKAVLALIAILFAPIAEELLFRGVLYPYIRKAGGRALAFWGTSIFFALVHSNLVTFIPLMAFAMMLASLYERFDNLAASITAHSIFNAANFIALIYTPKP